jgi:branched-chain amino acid aminotransferase
MGRIVDIDGELLPPERAFVSVFDRGFLYGDSVYEVLRTYRGVPFEVEAHFDRLRHSADLIALELPISQTDLLRRMKRAVGAAANAESYLRIVVTRGAGEIGLDPALGRDPKTILIVRELTSPPPEAYEKGVTIALVGVLRNPRKAIDPAAKTGNYLNNVLALAEARRAGATEAVMLDQTGRVTEGANSNVFALLGNRLITPALDIGLLPGVTRRVVLKLARSEALTVEEGTLMPSDLERADEVFITSTTREVLPVVRIVSTEKDWRVGRGEVGPVSRRLLARFRAYALEQAQSPVH